ncbi:toxin [Raoultibacter massiliensis]|uniref:Toxin n=1 Tax=Raoultibacter massiliensis TaxID=1852371 RepID=A0ABV1J8W1_9ACTN|nr:toxin [Raoultibacter massiliensis]
MEHVCYDRKSIHQLIDWGFMIAEKWKVESILALIKAVAFDDFVIAGLGNPAGKTSRHIQRVGYSVLQVYGVVQNLGMENYSSGPLADNKGRPHDVWVFGVFLTSIETYIKIAVFVSCGSVKAVCVSFHEAEHPLCYPYREEE